MTIETLQTNDPLLFAELQSFIKANEKRSEEIENIRNFKSTINMDRLSCKAERANGLTQLDHKELLALHQEKIFCLKGIMQNRIKKTKNIVIIGAGPAGLIRALVAIIGGYKVTLLEKRGDPQTKPDGRANILHLGHDTPSDIEFLLNYGVFESLVLDKSINKSPYGGYEVAINDLEKHLARMVDLFQPGALISSAGEVKIIPQANDKAHLIYNGGSTQADLVFLTEGAQSSLTKSLGMTYQTFTKKSIVPVGFFEPDRSIGADILRSISALHLIGTQLFPTLAKEEFEGVERNSLKKGILFRSDKRDYVGISLSKSDEDKIRSLKYEEKETFVKELLIQRHKEIDAAKALFLPNAGLPRAAKLMEYRIIPIQIKKAETPLFTAGKTLFLVRGDVHGTTNPASGYGAKTALSSCQEDRELLELFEWTGINPFITSPFIKSANESLRVSQGNGINATNEYRTFFEKIDFFLDLATTYKLFPSIDLIEIKNFLVKVKWMPLSQAEKKRVEAVREELVLGFQKKYCKEYATLQHSFDRNAFKEYLKIEGRIPSSEAEVLLGAIDPYHDRLQSSEDAFRGSITRYYPNFYYPTLPFSIFSNPNINLVAFFGLLGFIDKILFHKDEKEATSHSS